MDNLLLLEIIDESTNQNSLAVELGSDMEVNSGSNIKKLSPCDVEALKKCLEENKGDYVKCQAQIEAFKSSCSLKKPPSPQASS